MANVNAKINLFGIAPGSIVDGPGIRFGVFMQGCTHHCPGCHNLESQAFKENNIKTVSEILEQIQENQSCAGVTLSGGEPFDQSSSVCELAEALQENGFNVWCYTGYLFEDLLAIAQGRAMSDLSAYCKISDKDFVLKLLNNINVLVDGPFKQNLKSYDALYRGSTNQRLIDVEPTLKSNKTILWSQNFTIPERPQSW